MSKLRITSTPSITRRRLIAGMGMASAAAALPAWAQGRSVGGHHGGGIIRAGFDEVAGNVIDLAVGEGQRVVQGRRGHTVAVNGSVPGPLIRLREGP